MTVAVQPILGGSGTFEQLEVHGPESVYRGATVTAYDRLEARWVKQYVNSAKGRFVRIVGAADATMPSGTWHIDNVKRKARLTTSRAADGKWLRIMHVAGPGSPEWHELWRDELARL